MEGEAIKVVAGEEAIIKTTPAVAGEEAIIEENIATIGEEEEETGGTEGIK